MPSSHTPGPWEAVLENDPRGQPVAYYRAIIGLLANDKGYLSVVASDGRTVEPEEWEANARLIAKAPELQDKISRIAALFNAWANGDEPEGTPSTRRTLLAIGDVLGVPF